MTRITRVSGMTVVTWRSRMTRDDLDGGMLFWMTGMTRRTRMTGVTGMTRVTGVNKMARGQWDNWDDYSLQTQLSLFSLPAARDVSQERCLLLNEKNSTLTMQINVYIM